MAKKKKKRRKKNGWKQQLSRALQTTAALYPELKTTMEVYRSGDWSRWPGQFIYNRIGLRSDGGWEPEMAIMNNAISIGVPILIRKAMKSVR